MVYVDELLDYRNRADLARHLRREWCHMTADTVEELHAMAGRLGLKREWFQNHHKRPELHHYDLTRNKRMLALRLGAQFVPAMDQAHARQIVTVMGGPNG